MFGENETKMMKVCQQKSFCLNHFVFVSSLLSVLVFTGGCSKSSDPEVSEIFPLQPPLIFGETNGSMVIPSPAFTIEGECDFQLVDTLEFRLFDEDKWRKVPGGCQSDGTYSFQTYLPRKTVVSVRGKRDSLVSDPARYEFEFVKPPSAPLMDFVTSSNSPVGSFFKPVLSHTMPNSYIGHNVGGDTFNIQFHATGIIYEED